MSLKQAKFQLLKNVCLVPIIGISLLFNSCDKQTLSLISNQRLYFENIKLDRSLSEFDNTPEYFFEIRRIDRFGDEIIAQNHANQRMYIMDLDMKFKRAIINYGEGPEEFKYAGNAVMYNGEFFTVDYQKKRLVRLSPEGEFISSFRINNWFGTGEILVKNNKIYLHNNLKHGLDILDYEGNLEGVIQLSKPIDFGKNMPFIILNKLQDCFLIGLDNKLPFLEVLDEKGNKIAEINLEKLPLLKKGMEMQKEFEIKNPMSSVVFFEDIKVVDRDIFILLNVHDDVKGYHANTLAHLTFNNNNLEFIDSFVLNAGNVYKSFVVIPERKKIIAYESVQNRFDIYSYN